MKKLRFRGERLQESRAHIRNPGRGFYRIHSFDISESPDVDSLYWSVDPEDSLGLVFFNIAAYRDRQIDGTAIARIREVMEVMRAKDVEVILRIAYDNEGRAGEREPSSFEVVSGHYRQLLDIFEEYADIIYVWQGMLIGNWGEMHGSRYIYPERLLDLYAIYRDSRLCRLHRVPLAVRSPKLWRILNRREVYIGNDAEGFPTVGIFDDAIMGGLGDLGTFRDGSFAERGWIQAWGRDSELEFMERIARAVPMGGEVLFGDESFDANRALDGLRARRVSYLNRDHQISVIDGWRQTGAESILSKSSVFREASFFELVQAALGYRFYIDSVRLLRKGGFFSHFGEYVLEIGIENRGFGYICRETALYVVFESGGKVCERRLDGDLRTIAPGERDSFSLCIGMDKPAGYSVNIYLRAEDSRKRHIHFANTGSDLKGTLLGVLA